MDTLSELQELRHSAVSLVPSSPTLRGRLVDYYELTKPRMNFLVVVTTMVGYYMAAHGQADSRAVPLTPRRSRPRTGARLATEAPASSKGQSSGKGNSRETAVSPELTGRGRVVAI